jgi:uncharacterized protein (DUF1015 family)
VVDVAPFRALRYDARVVGDLGAVTAPPYDVIPPAAVERFERASPYNVVRLILARAGADGDQYTRAARVLEAWVREGALVRDATECLTLYEQRATIGGREHVQRGVLAAVGLAGEGAILPHEETTAGPVEDRLRLLRATRTNLSPVFGVVTGVDPTWREVLARAAARDPDQAFATADDGVRHRVWRLEDPAEIERLRRALAPAAVVIADGHHRFRTALLYREERRAVDGPGPWDAMLFHLVDASWHGPALRPIHRVVPLPPEEVLRRVRGALEVSPAPGEDPEALATELERRRGAGRLFALWGPEGAWWLAVADEATARAARPAGRSAVWRGLDVAVLERYVCDRLLGVAPRPAHSAAEAAEAARAEGGSALFLAPPSLEEVRAVAAAGEAMPPKSTFFLPKPRTGVVLRPLDGPAAS